MLDAARLRRLARDPLGVMKRRFDFYWSSLRYRTRDGYDARSYWSNRLARHRFDLRGVGLDHLTHEENAELYEDAKRVVVGLCHEEGVDFGTARILDVGCGTGFYAEACAEQGATRYTGLDITDVLHSALAKKYPHFSFRVLDISRDHLEGEYDVLLMIDVTQHITSDAGFSYAMANVARAVASDGVFVVTSWLNSRDVRSFAERSRGLADYEREFPGWRFSAPRPFRDKFIFSLRPPSR